MRYILFICFFFTTVYADEIGSIEFRLGELFIKNQQTEGWVPEIDEGDSVMTGDTLKTGIESKCEIKLFDKSIIRMAEKTIYSFIKTEKDGFEGMIIEGSIWSNIEKKDKSERIFETKTPVAVAAVVGTKYRVSYKDGISSVAVLEGKVKVDLTKETKKELGIVKKESFGPREVGGPKEIPGPYEVTLSEWISIVAGEVINIRSDGKYEKDKIDVELLNTDWENYR